MTDAGDESSDRVDEFVRLLGRNQRRIFLYVMSLVPDWNDAEEIIQETNLVLWREFDKFQLGTNFTAWACKVALHQVMAWRKRVRRDRLQFSPAFLEAVADEAASSTEALEERSQQLAHCIDRLPVDRARPAPVALRGRSVDPRDRGSTRPDRGSHLPCPEPGPPDLARLRRPLTGQGVSVMTASWDDHNELHALCEATIEGTLTAEQRERLEQLVLERSPGASALRLVS